MTTRDGQTSRQASVDIVLPEGRFVTRLRLVAVLELYTPLCTIYADTSQVSRQVQSGPNGTYYVQNFKIVLLCGMTELQAQLSWTENVRTS